MSFEAGRGGVGKGSTFSEGLSTNYRGRLFIFRAIFSFLPRFRKEITYIVHGNLCPLFCAQVSKLAIKTHHASFFPNYVLWSKLKWKILGRQFFYSQVIIFFIFYFFTILSLLFCQQELQLAS